MVRIRPLLLVLSVAFVNPFANLAGAQDFPPLTPLPPSEPVPQVQPDDPAKSLFLQGIKQYQAVQFDAAIQSWQQALTLFRQRQNRKAEALTLENLGLAYQAVGNYRSAIAHYQQQLTIVRELGDRRAEANALANLGNNYRILGNYTDAMTCGRQSLEIRRQLGDRQGAGQVLANLGNVQADLGNYPQAIELQKRSLKIAQEANNQRGAIIALNSLGFLYSSQANYADARKAYEQSLELARTTGFRAAEGNALNNLGVVYHAQGHYQQAIDHYQKSLAIAHALSDPRMESTALAGLGFGHASLRDYATALKYQQQSWVLASKLGDRRLEGIALSNWGDTLWQSGNLSAAEQKVKAALEILESLRSNLADADKVSIFDTQRVNYNTLQQIQIAQNRPEAALETAERGRARAFAELLAKRTRESGRERATAAAPLSLAPPSIQQIRQIAREQNATLVEYAVIPEDRFVAIGKLTGPDLALFIWVVQPTGKVDFRRVDLKPLREKKLTLAEVVSIGRCLGSVSTCLSQTARLTRGLGVIGNSELTQQPTTSASTPTSQRRSHPGLQKLHQLLIAPIANLLPTDPNARIVFIPQDSLFLVPFPALQSAQNDYLIEQHTLQTAPSIQVLALTRQQRESRSRTADSGRQPTEPAPSLPSLVVGNPTMPKLSLRPGDPPAQLSPLPGAEQEAKEIATLLNTTALIHDAPTERMIREKLPQARLVHLATHGLLEYGTQSNHVSLEGVGIPGAIALAPPPTPSTPSDDGLLTSSEILDLHLNAELVVLSACDTGQGRITGDGVIGLSRAFISAGVPSVVVSLWAVPDAPTARLMTTFYRNLQSSSGKSEPDKAIALRQAMLETMQEHPRPLDWAAFTLIGEAR